MAMAEVAVASNGTVTLQPSGPGTSAVLLRLPSSVLRHIADANGVGVRLVLGKNPQLKVGDVAYRANLVTEGTQVEVYVKDGTIYRGCGIATHKISVQNGDPNQTSTSLKTQQSNLLREKEANKATLLATSNGSNGARRNPVKRLTTNGNASPREGMRSAGGSPAPDGGSLRHPRTVQAVNKKPLSAMSLTSGPMRVLHLLALAPLTPNSVALRTNMPIPEADAILKEHAKPLSDGKYALAENRYKDLRVWEWKHYSNAERRKVIEDSSAAFDALGYPKDHVARRNLIDPAVRREQKRNSPPLSASRPSTPVMSSAPQLSPALSSSSRFGGLLSPRSEPSSIPTSEEKGKKHVSASGPVSQGMRKVGALLKQKGIATKRARAPPPSASSSSSSPSPVKNDAREAPNSSPSDSGGSDGANSPLPGLSATSGKPVTSSAPSSPPKRKAAAMSGSAGLSSSGNAEPMSKKLATVPRSIPKQPQQSVNGNRATSQQDDMFDLARRFRSTYSEYEKLYASLASRGSRPKSQLQKLLSMHNELRAWKQTLWASAGAQPSGST